MKRQLKDIKIYKISSQELSLQLMLHPNEQFIGEMKIHLQRTAKKVFRSYFVRVLFNTEHTRTT